MESINDFEYIILKYLSVAGRGVTTRKIAEKTQMSWVTAKKYLKELTKDGLIELYKEDGRIKWRVREENLDMPTMEHVDEFIAKIKNLKKKKN